MSDSWQYQDDDLRDIISDPKLVLFLGNMFKEEQRLGRSVPQIDSRRMLKRYHIAWEAGDGTLNRALKRMVATGYLTEDRKDLRVICVGYFTTTKAHVFCEQGGRPVEDSTPEEISIRELRRKYGPKGGLQSEHPSTKETELSTIALPKPHQLARLELEGAQARVRAVEKSLAEVRQKLAGRRGLLERKLANPQRWPESQFVALRAQISILQKREREDLSALQEAESALAKRQKGNKSCRA